jgi:hypothetical protein
MKSENHMSKGREDLHRLQQALNGFEDAIVRREHKKMLESKVPLQQQVDTAHKHVVDVVVSLVTEARLAPRE